jgi:hypothetical protein
MDVGSRQQTFEGALDALKPGIVAKSASRRG